MDVTRRNFKFILDKFKKNLKTSTFYAVDLELTGLPETKRSFFDPSVEKYKYFTQKVGEIKAIQVGVTLFEDQRSDNTFKSSTYTFHLAPQTFGSLDQKIEWQAGAIQFLIKHDLKIEKNFYDGIPYMNEEEERKIINDMSTENFDFDIDLMNTLRSNFLSIEKFMASPEKAMNIPCSTSLFYSIIKHIKNTYPTLQIQYTDLHEITLSKENQSESKNKDVTQDIIEHCRGFSNVINVLSESQKPLIVHNGLIDLLIIHNQFIKPLPSKYEDFKACINKVFPKVFDTKIIANDLKFLVKKENFCGTSLAELYGFFNDFKKSSLLFINSPFVTMNDDFDSTKVEEKMFHEAGWDSYCTGFIFLKLCHWAVCSQKETCRKYTFTEYLYAIDKYLNRVSLTKSATPYICLDKNDPPKQVQNYIHVETIDNSNIDIQKVGESLGGYHLINIKKHGKNNCVLVTVGGNLKLNNVIEALQKRKEFKVTKYNIIKHTHTQKLYLWGILFAATGGIVVLGISIMKNS